jgi:hypothetical protein
MPEPRHGRVVFPDGSPAPRALVAVASGTAPTPEIGIRCDAEGRFRIALPPGHFRIGATASDGSTGVVDAAGGPEGKEIVITVQPGQR